MICACCDISINDKFVKFPKWREQFCERCAHAIRKIALNDINYAWIADYDGKSIAGILEFTSGCGHGNGFKRLEFKKSDILMVAEIDKFME